MTTVSLLELFLQSTGVCTDTRQLQPGNLFVALKGPNFDGNTYAQQAIDAGAHAAVVDDVTLKENKQFVLVEDGLLALQTLARDYRRTFTCPVVALTGSNGKTTTKELLARCLTHAYSVSFTQGNLNNHIGVPLTLLRVPPDADIVLVEMGANHQREIAALCAIAEPTHGFITNIGRAHLEGFGGIEGVRKGKGELFDFLADTDGCAFVDVEDAVVMDVAKQVGRRLRYRATEQMIESDANEPIELVVGQLVSAFPSVTMKLSAGDNEVKVEAQLPGTYNFKNLVQAAAVAHYFKVPLMAIETALSTYQAENARSQETRIGKASVLVDSYNANPDSMRAALSWLGSRSEGQRIAVLGEMKELGAFAKTAHETLLEQCHLLTGLRVIATGIAYEHQRGRIPGVEVIQNTDEVSEQLAQLFNQEDTVVLLKGSRSNRLELVLAKAKELYTNRL